MVGPYQCSTTLPSMRLGRPAPLTRDLAVLIGAFAALRVYAVAGLSPVRFSDTGTYFDLSFFGNSIRLWTVPLLYNALPSDELRVAGQVALAVAAWGYLAWAVGRACSHPLVARALPLAVLLVGLTPQVTQWDGVLLSESF